MLPRRAQVVEPGNLSTGSKGCRVFFCFGGIKIPFAQEHAARIKSPNSFERFRRKELTAGVSAILGFKDGESEIQALRFLKDKFTAQEARDWLRDHDMVPLEFVAATEKRDLWFSRNSQLPDQVLNLPEEAKTAWRHAANKAAETYSDEGRICAMAWSGLRKAGWVRKAGQWSKQESHEPQSTRFDFKVEKADAKKRLAFGWAIPLLKSGDPIVDLQGDMIDLETLETAAYDFVLHSREAGVMHEENGGGKGEMVESFVASAEKFEAMGVAPKDAEKKVSKGWWVGFRLAPDVFEKVVSKEYPMFSIQGMGERVDLNA